MCRITRAAAAIRPMLQGQRLTLRRALKVVSSREVPAFADGADGVVGAVELLLDIGAGTVLRLLERDGDRAGFALVAQVAEHAQVVVGPGGQQRQDLAVFPQGGGVVFTAGTYR
jgi:hypothetical protein